MSHFTLVNKAGGTVKVAPESMTAKFYASVIAIMRTHKFENMEKCLQAAMDAWAVELGSPKRKVKLANMADSIASKMEVTAEEGSFVVKPTNDGATFDSTFLWKSGQPASCAPDNSHVVYDAADPTYKARYSYSDLTKGFADDFSRLIFEAFILTEQVLLQQAQKN